MTISTTTDKTIASGNGATTVFNYNFLIQANSQMVVIFTDANGNQTTLSPAVYSVTGAGNPSGGTVTYPLSGSPIATGTTLTMFRTLTLQQLTSLKNQGSFNPSVVEAALDYLMMTAQQLNDNVGRSIVAPIVDSNPGVILPPASQRKNLSLGFDANGNVALVSALNSLSVSGYAVLLLQQASAAAERSYLGSTTVGDAIFIASNAAAAITALGLNALGGDLTGSLPNPTLSAKANGVPLLSGQAIVASQNPTTVTGWVPRSYLAGCGLSTAGGSTTITINAGECTDSTNVSIMKLLSNTAKTTSSWAVGTGNGGLDTGSIANSTWYHFWIIMRPDTGVSDVLFSLSATSPTMPTNYTLKRRIGSWLIDGSGKWFQILQDGDRFRYITIQQDYSQTNPGTSAVIATLTSIPTGVNVTAMLQVIVDMNSVSLTTFRVYEIDTANITPVLATLGDGTVEASTAGSSEWSYQRMFIRLNTSGQLQYQFTISNASLTIKINVLGWIDRRGQDS